MTPASLILFFSLTLAVPPLLVPSVTEYTQSYVILLKGIPAGSEQVLEKITESGELISTSDHELFITDGLGTKRMTYSTKMVLSKGSLAPLSYAYQYTTGNTGDSYEVSITNGRIRRVLNRGGHADEINIPVPLNLVILDFNVYHQYDYLIRRYDAKQGGRQVFADFVPLIGNDIPVALTYLGDAEIGPEKSPIPAKNYKIEFVGVWSGSLLVDREGRLLRLQIPAQDLEVVRRDLMPLPETKN